MRKGLDYEILKLEEKAVKKFAAFLLTLMMAVSLAACAGNNDPAATNSPDVGNSVSEETSVPESGAAQPGETEKAEPAPETDPYTEADLNYNDNNSRTTIEMNDPSARPAISGSVENMEQYTIVFLGYPKISKVNQINFKK